MARETRGDFHPAPIVDNSTRPGAITRLVIFVVVLTGAAIVFGLFRERLGDPFLLGMLGVLAMIAVAQGAAVIVASALWQHGTRRATRLVAP